MANDRDISIQYIEFSRRKLRADCKGEKTRCLIEFIGIHTNRLPTIEISRYNISSFLETNYGLTVRSKNLDVLSSFQVYILIDIEKLDIFGIFLDNSIAF